MNDWTDDDLFWERMRPFLFSEEKWAGTAEEVDLVSELVELERASDVLDMGCGPGRHSLELARRGHRVTGVDRTRPYLQEARRRAEAEGLDIEFVLEDMRQFRRPESYDLALSMYTTFGYFKEHEENMQVLRNVFEALRLGGVLVVDMMGKEVLARIFQKRDWREVNGVYILEDRNVANDWSWMDLSWIMIAGGEKTEYRLGHWLYSGLEMKRMLREAGFAQVEMYGSLEGAPYDLAARRQVAVSWKA